MIKNLFGLTAHGATARREIAAGVMIFFSMAYIMFVNPQILAAAGMDRGVVLGTSPVTAHIESAARAGGRTGLAAVTMAALFAND